MTPFADFYGASAAPIFLFLSTPRGGAHERAHTPWLIWSHFGSRRTRSTTATVSCRSISQRLARATVHNIARERSTVRLTSTRSLCLCSSERACDRGCRRQHNASTSSAVAPSFAILSLVALNSFCRLTHCRRLSPHTAVA